MYQAGVTPLPAPLLRLLFRYFLRKDREDSVSVPYLSLFSAQRYKKIPISANYSWIICANGIKKHISADYPVKRSAISNPPGRLAGDFLLNKSFIVICFCTVSLCLFCFNQKEVILQFVRFDFVRCMIQIHF